MDRIRNLVHTYFSSMRFIAFIGIVFLISASSCDKIDNPVIQKAGNATLPNTPPDHTNKTSDSTLHKALLEDYMGHFCTNCPAAIAEAENLLAGANGNKIVMMEVNVGVFADTAGEPGGILPPPGLPATAYKIDYRTQAGNDWDARFISSGTLGLPQGMVDRVYYSGPGTPDIQYANWGTVIDSIVATPQTASITMADSCWYSKQVFGAAITTTLKNAPAPGTSYYLEAVLVEDSIYDWQTNGGTAVQYFLHRNVLRTALNGSWGDSLSLSAGVPATKYYAFTSPKFSYNGAAITTPPQVPPDHWNMAHCYVLAFLYQRNSSAPANYYVLQAQILHL